MKMNGYAADLMIAQKMDSSGGGLSVSRVQDSAAPAATPGDVMQAGLARRAQLPSAVMRSNPAIAQLASQLPPTARAAQAVQSANNASDVLSAAVDQMQQAASVAAQVDPRSQERAAADAMAQRAAVAAKAAQDELNRAQKVMTQEIAKVPSGAGVAVPAAPRAPAVTGVDPRQVQQLIANSLAQVRDQVLSVTQGQLADYSQQVAQAIGNLQQGQADLAAAISEMRGAVAEAIKAASVANSNVQVLADNVEANLGVLDTNLRNQGEAIAALSRGVVETYTPRNVKMPKLKKPKKGKGVVNAAADSVIDSSAVVRGANDSIQPGMRGWGRWGRG